MESSIRSMEKVAQVCIESLRGKIGNGSRLNTKTKEHISYAVFEQSFVIEILLKSLLVRERKQFDKIHKLESLFHELDSSTQDFLEKEFWVGKTTEIAFCVTKTPIPPNAPENDPGPNTLLELLQEFDKRKTYLARYDYFNEVEGEWKRFILLDKNEFFDNALKIIREGVAD